MTLQISKLSIAHKHFEQKTNDPIAIYFMTILFLIRSNSHAIFFLSQLEKSPE